MENKLDFIKGYEEAVDLFESAIDVELAFGDAGINTSIMALHVARLNLEMMKKELEKPSDEDCDGDCDNCDVGKMIATLEKSLILNFMKGGK